MRRHSTEQAAASVELLLLLPLCAGLAWGTGIVARGLRDLSRTGREAWVHGVSLAHHAPSTPPPPYRVERSPECEAGDPALPASYQILRARSCGTRERISLPDGPGVSISVPGSDFLGSDLLRELLWREAMLTAGFGSLPLRMLAVPELSYGAPSD